MNNTEEDKKAVKTPRVATPQKPVQPENKISSVQINTLKSLLTPEREPKLLEYFKVEKIEDLSVKDFTEALTILQTKK